MKINVKHNVGDKIRRIVKWGSSVSYCSGSDTEQLFRIERIIIDRGNSFNGWKPKFHYECQDVKSGNFIILNNEEIDEYCSVN